MSPRGYANFAILFLQDACLAISFHGQTTLEHFKVFLLPGMEMQGWLLLREFQEPRMVKFENNFEGKGPAFGRVKYSCGNGTLETGITRLADDVHVRQQLVRGRGSIDVESSLPLSSQKESK